MTIETLLWEAQGAVQVIQSLPLVGLDPRIALGCQLLSGVLDMVQSLHRQGVFDPHQTLTMEVDDISLALLANIKAQLTELGQGATP